MQDRMLDAAAVEVDGTPVADLFGIERKVIVFWIAEAEKVPGRIHERVHRVGLAARRAAARWARRVDEFGDVRERRVAAAAELRRLRKQHGKLIGWHGNHAAGIAIHDRNRRAPISLTRNPPVLEAVLNRGLPD